VHLTDFDNHDIFLLINKNFVNFAQSKVSALVHGSKGIERVVLRLVYGGLNKASTGPLPDINHDLDMGSPPLLATRISD
jgi:hypothetical protein